MLRRWAVSSWPWAVAAACGGAWRHVWEEAFQGDTSSERNLSVYCIRGLYPHSRGSGGPYGSEKSSQFSAAGDGDADGKADILGAIRLKDKKNSVPSIHPKRTVPVTAMFHDTDKSRPRIDYLLLHQGASQLRRDATIIDWRGNEILP